MKSFKITILVLLTLALGFNPLSLNAQKEIKLKRISSEMVVDVSPEKAWEIINSYGNIGDYHSGVQSSRPMNGSMIEGSVGCERQCNIQNGKKMITVDEKIIEFEPGSHYKYAAESPDFPAKAFYNTFGVKVDKGGKTVIYVITEYRLKPGFMTGIASGKLRKGNDDALLFYKHFMETGEENGDPDKIRKKYTKA